MDGKKPEVSDHQIVVSHNLLEDQIGQNHNLLDPPLYKGIKTCIEDLGASTENPANTGKEIDSMATAKDILAAKESKTTIKGSQDTMALKWVKEVSGVTGEFCPGLTMKEKGMLGQVAKAVGKEKALEALQRAIRDWLTFTHTVKNSKGIQTAPAAPSIPFFVQHYGVLLASPKQVEAVAMPAHQTPEELDSFIDAWNAKKKGIK